MSAFLDRIQLSQKQLIVLARELNEKLEKSREGGPIAVIGMASGFPGGANTPEAYWKLQREGRDAIREFPADRWDMDPGCIRQNHRLPPLATSTTSHTRCGSVGTAPLEPPSMDLQQRLMLETTWEVPEWRPQLAPMEKRPQSETQLTNRGRELGAKSLEA